MTNSSLMLAQHTGLCFITLYPNTYELYWAKLQKTCNTLHPINVTSHWAQCVSICCNTQLQYDDGHSAHNGLDIQLGSPQLSSVSSPYQKRVMSVSRVIINLFLSVCLWREGMSTSEERKRYSFHAHFYYCSLNGYPLSEGRGRPERHPGTTVHLPSQSLYDL